MAKRLGSGTLLLENSPSVLSFGAVGTKKEGEGPLGNALDRLWEDSMLGEDTWEKAECRLQKEAVGIALEKGGFTPEDLHFIFAGDLLNQCISSTYSIRDLGVPFVGLFGACSTMAEGLAMASLFVEGGFGERAAAATSSHFCSAERQFRFPLEYGGQRTPTSQWTVTGSGAAIVGKGKQPPFVRGVTIGRMKDMGITDANNMGAAMAPAASDTIARFFRDTGKRPENFDLIATGDLGQVGSTLLLELLAGEGISIAGQHNDCGLMIYDRERQQVEAGGSGCGCSATVLCSHILPELRQGALRNVLFIATGALMSPTAVQQGESIPGIAHLVWLSGEPGPGGGQAG